MEDLFNHIIYQISQGDFPDPKSIRMTQDRFQKVEEVINRRKRNTGNQELIDQYERYLETWKLKLSPTSV